MTITLEEQFDVAGVPANVTSVKLSNAAGTAGVIRNDTEAVVVADGVDMENTATGLYRYTFTEPAVGLTYTYWVEWVYAGETYRDEKTYTSAVRSNFNSSRGAMGKDECVAWLTTQIAPLTAATPTTTIEQVIDNAVAFWNTHAGFAIITMFETPASGEAVQLNAQFKDVVEVWPSNTTGWVFNNHPLWTLTGIQLLDNITGDMIMLSEAFRNYQVYIGSDMRFTYTRSNEPEVGGMLSLINVPIGSEQIAVRGLKRITATEQITDEHIVDWILNYAWALFKIIEGHTLRTAEIADIKTPGRDYVKEGYDEKKALEEQLAYEGRWVTLAQRG
jgi:hypothetical protein